MPAKISCDKRFGATPLNKSPGVATVDATLSPTTCLTLKSEVAYFFSTVLVCTLQGYLKNAPATLVTLTKQAGGVKNWGKSYFLCDGWWFIDYKGT